MAYDGYHNIEFNIPVTFNGDCYDRYLIRVFEMRESCKILNSVTQRLSKKFTEPSLNFVKVKD
jgi:NADH-quinone oxidoreductase subunit D